MKLLLALVLSLAACNALDWNHPKEPSAAIELSKLEATATW